MREKIGFGVRFFVDYAPWSSLPYSVTLAAIAEAAIAESAATAINVFFMIEFL